MIETIDIEPGRNPDFRADRNRSYIALEIAKANGYGSERWTRDRRAELEEMLSTCEGAGQLVKSLKTSDGKRYTQFAVDLIAEYTRFTSAYLPVVKGGETVKSKDGQVKLRLRSEDDPERKTPEDFQKTLWSRYGKASQGEVFNPAVPSGILGELDEADEEEAPLYSTRLEFTHADTGADSASALDFVATVAGDTSGSFQAFMSTVLASDRAAGEQLGAMRVQELAAGMQDTMNAGLKSLAKGVQPPTPKRTGRKSQKKSVSQS